MIRNGRALLDSAPLEPMIECKVSYGGVTYGLSEAGYDIRIAQELELAPGANFALASTVEYFHLPDDLVGVVHDKSTWARKGLSVFNTVIEPGWFGYLTLELVYHGDEPLTIPLGCGIAQVLFHEVHESRRYAGRYQDQPNHPVGAIEA